jgi:uroporphyrinogen decarboxylase
MAERHIEYYRATGLDIMKVMNDTGYAPVGTVKIERPEDWAHLQPTPLSDPAFQSHMEGLRGIVEAIGDEVLIMTTAFNPYNQAVAILRASDPNKYEVSGDAREALLHHLRTNPRPVMEGLQVIAEDLAGYYRACITETGINGIYYSAQGGERDLMSDAEHGSYVKPYDLHVLNEVGEVAEFIVGHYCGKGINLERFVDYPVQMANWAHQSDNLSLSEGKRLFGGMPVLGGLDERGPLVYGPREALREEVRAAVAEMSAPDETYPPRGFMLGAGCTVPGDTDLDNLTYARSLLAPENWRQ